MYIEPRVLLLNLLKSIEIKVIEIKSIKFFTCSLSAYSSGPMFFVVFLKIKVNSSGTGRMFVEARNILKPV